MPATTAPARAEKRDRVYVVILPDGSQFFVDPKNETAAPIKEMSDLGKILVRYPADKYMRSEIAVSTLDNVFATKEKADKAAAEAEAKANDPKTIAERAAKAKERADKAAEKAKEAAKAAAKK